MLPISCYEKGLPDDGSPLAIDITGPENRCYYRITEPVII